MDDSTTSDSDEDEDTCSDVEVDGLEDSDKNSNSDENSDKESDGEDDETDIDEGSPVSRERTRRVHKKQKSVKDRAVGQEEDKNVAVREGIKDIRIGMQTSMIRPTRTSKDAQL